MIDIKVGESVEKGFRLLSIDHEKVAFLDDTVAADIASATSNKLTNLGFMDLVKDILFIVEIIAIIVSLGILIGLVTIVYKYHQFGRERKAAESDKIPEPASGGMLTGRWAEIMDHMRSERETEWKLAVIEADNLIDDLLKKAGYPGESMGERLTGMRHEQLRTLPYLWKAHLLRNKIVHETDYKANYQEIHEALRAYEATLEELGAL